jgi:uncharacterized membrane protein YfcA
MHSAVSSVKSAIITYHARMPHLPENARRWLSDNLWWIVLMAALFGAFGVAILVLITLLGGVFLAGAVFLFSAKFGGLALLLMTAAVGLMVTNVIVSIMAIKPLQAKVKRGWNLLCLSLVIGFVAALLTDAVRHDIGAVIKDVLLVSIGMYVMLELRRYFPVMPRVDQ